MEIFASFPLLKALLKWYRRKKDRKARNASIHRMIDKDKKIVELKKEQIKKDHEIGVLRRNIALNHESGSYLVKRASSGISVQCNYTKMRLQLMEDNCKRDIAIAKDSLEKYLNLLDAELDLRIEQRLGGISSVGNDKESSFELEKLYNSACNISNLVPTEDEINKM